MTEITVLIENTAPDHLEKEHGLSLYLRHNGRAWLLDAGQSARFAANAAALDCPLEEAAGAVLSHGHFDHADGLPHFLSLNPDTKVYARTAALEPRYDPAKPERYIGVCRPLQEQLRPRVVLCDEVRAIDEDLFLVPDALDHEQSLVARTQRGLVVMNSCCHAGVDNIVRDILARFPGERVYAVLGGFHLMAPGGVETLGKTPEEVTTLARTLTEELGVEQVCTGHCTGFPAYALLEQSIPNNLFHLTGGARFTF